MKKIEHFKPTFGTDSDGNLVDAYMFASDSTFKIRKIIRPERTNKNGLTKVIIECRIHYYGGTGKYLNEYCRIGTKVWIHTKNWNKKDQLIKPTEPNAYILNKDIDKAFFAVKQFIDSKGAQSVDQVYVEGFSLEALRKFFPSRKENRKSMYDYITDYIEYRKGQKTVQNTLKEFKSMQNRLKAFDDYRSKKTQFEDINLIWSDDFEYYLKNVAKYKIKGIEKTGYADGTVQKTYTILVTVLNHFYNRRKQLQIDLSDDFRIKSTVGSENGFKRGSKSINEANPLTKEQLETIYNHQFKKRHMRLIKDRFLWQCYTGLRYGTAFIVTKEHVKNNWLRIKPSKTIRFGVKVEQPLNPVAREILEKYKYDMTSLKITNQAYNRELKHMFKILKAEYPTLHYQTDYGTYCSRDTFITMAVQKEANWKDILRWVGQSSYKIMDRYIKTEDRHQERKVKSIFPTPNKPKQKKQPLLKNKVDET
jgi:hypothetical protein